MKRKKIKSCLITGATGLIGRELINNQLKDWNVFAITRERKSDFSSEVNIIQHDFLSGFDTGKFPKKVDIIIHLAQSEFFREFPHNAQETFAINTLSTLQLLNYAQTIKVKQFILASTGSVYGSGDLPFSESVPLVSKKPMDFYPITKLCSEKIADSYNKIMNVIILRPFFVYGPGQNPTMLIPRLIHSVKENQPIILQGSDGIKINPIFVSDAAKAIAKAAELNENHIINIGGGEILSLKTIGNVIGNSINKKPVFSVHRNETPKNLIGDVTKMSELLWKPEVTFKKGIEKMLK